MKQIEIQSRGETFTALDDLLPKVVDISEPTEGERQIYEQITEIKRRHMAELEPYYQLASAARLRRSPKYVMEIPGEGKTLV